MEEKNLALDWLELAASKGIKALGQKLQSKCGKKLILTGRQGIAHYPETGIMVPAVVQELLVNMPEFGENQYYYGKNQRMLVFKVVLKDMPDSTLLLIWEQVNTEEISSISNTVETARLALTWYLRGHKEFARRLHEQRIAFFEGVFIKHNISVESLLKEQGIDIHSDREYAVMLMDMGEKQPLIPPADFRAKLLQFRQRHQTELIYPLEWNGLYLVIIPGIYNQQEFNFLSTGKREELFARWQQLFSEAYKVDVSIGVGLSYPLAELHRSYREARIALMFRQIKGAYGFVQKFADLGIFREFFGCEQERIIRFCRQTLDKLLAYDHDCDAGLQITLRTLMDTNFNYKLTAEKLFVHVNTVRYRCDKIAQLLDIDLNHPDTRFNLYAALRVGDVLKALNLLQPGYVGNINHKNSGTETQTLF
ncbi:transcriptional regulator, CdaR family [Selenomonas ruminantium]|uniref:Transcriptional regulator, CdaR family n=1 Tax=Selenomonas ruminantium TaxID=971 RepID=A0A1M6WAD9_SELRU|nr:helix-turn-helix domain-containing protein [Selenomonas ruminantium]SHK90455.1 transcriptional regulator, CdaR family [Selenomonas ruminantium]